MKTNKCLTFVILLLCLKTTAQATEYTPFALNTTIANATTANIVPNATDTTAQSNATDTTAQPNATDTTAQPNATDTTAQTTICPVVKEGALGICGMSCEMDTDCYEDMKCCPSACGSLACLHTDKVAAYFPEVEESNSTSEEVTNEI
ncbi:WAP four-disulfide core domain protein 2-like [Bombina bombina]|uniref:WAP four-disulfide core domain protein 2-like n=1 Tax=Bombina bombina TaxID=8345 RepID=UPI00235A6398|nr:WAP four-disulfide core domain protein 2-like [Bombina bombina]